MQKGANLILKTTKAIESGNVPSHKQDAVTTLHQAPKIFKETCKIDWTKSSGELINFVRGLSPYPGAWTDEFNGEIFKIYKCSPLETREYPDTQTGMYTNNKDTLAIKTGDGWLRIIELQLQGKKRMMIEDFLRGYDFK